MFDIRIFRFDPKIDVLSYFKPYFYENLSFNTLYDLLVDIKSNDPYFDFYGVNFVKINGVVVSLNENLSRLTTIFGKRLEISPLCEKRSVKDLQINMDDFLAIFELFSEFESEKDFYISLYPHYYSSEILSVNETLPGNSAYIFAAFLLEKFPERSAEILAIIKPFTAYFTMPKFLNDPFNLAKSYEILCEKLSYNLPKKAEILEIPADFKAKKSLENFSVAVYNNKNIEKFLASNNANIVLFEKFQNTNGTAFLANDKNTALKLAGEILFDAFDSGADFLVVNYYEDFEIFDTFSREIEKIFNRELIDFYVLKFDELCEILNAKEPQSLKNHKLKVYIL